MADPVPDVALAPAAAPAVTSAPVPAPENDPLDYSEKYNTPLSKTQQAQFNQWAERQRQLGVGNQLSPYDYDITGWWKANGGKNAPDLTGGHLTDTFKKPNHMTFSTGSQYHGKEGNEGGTWTKGDNNTWTFTPGKTNLKNYSEEELNDYFAREENPHGNRLVMPTRSKRGNWYDKSKQD